MARLRERALAWLHRRPEARAWTLLAPGGFWLFAFFLIPILIMFVYSVMPRGIYGGVDRGFTLEHYARFFDPLYLEVLQRTFLWSVACTVICLLLGYPVAYVIVRSGQQQSQVLDWQAASPVQLPVLQFAP